MSNVAVLKTRAMHATDTRYCGAVITRVYPNDDGTIELCFDFTTSSQRSKGSYLPLPAQEWQSMIVFMPRYAFIGFLASIGFSGDPDEAMLLKRNTPLLGLQFDALLELTPSVSDTRLFGWDILHTKMIDAKPRLGVDLSANLTVALVREAASNPVGPVFYDSVSVHSFQQAGYIIEPQYNDYADRSIIDYQRREMIFQGKKPSASGFGVSKSGKARESMIIVASHKSDRDTLITFLCTRQIGGLHTIIPIYEGAPFFCRDQNDADVAQILGECRRRKQSRPPTPELSTKG